MSQPSALNQKANRKLPQHISMRCNDKLAKLMHHMRTLQDYDNSTHNISRKLRDYYISRFIIFPCDMLGQIPRASNENQKEIFLNFRSSRTVYKKYSAKLF